MKPPKVRNDRGYCLLRFTVNSTRYSLTTGYFDDPSDYRKAQKIAIQIAEDVDNGLFTGDLDAYRDNATGFNKGKILALLKNKYSESSNPIYQGLIKHTQAYHGEIRNTVEAEKFFDSLDISTASKRRYYTALRSFKELKPIFDFPIIRPKDELKKEIDPFTESEVKRILETFKNHELYSFIAFLTFTGCRPGEARALEWDDLTFDGYTDTVTARISKSLDSQGNVKTTKTGKIRVVPLPKNLVEILLEKKDKGRMFPGSEDKAQVRWSWKCALRQANVRYRPLYNLRHSYITHCLVKGVTVATVAKWCGNSPEVIYKHYAGSLSSESLPELY